MRIICALAILWMLVTIPVIEYQDKVIRQQEGLILKMTKNPACMSDLKVYKHKPVIVSEN